MSNSIIAGCGFHHVAMKVANFDQVVAFYTEGLGFSVNKQWPGAIMLDAGDGVCLEIFPDGRFETVDNSYVHVAFKVDDVDAALARAAAYGAKITIPPKDVDIASDPVFPVRIAFCVGLSGETIEFFHEK